MNNHFYEVEIITIVLNMKLKIFVMIFVLLIAVGCEKDDVDLNQIVPVERLVVDSRYSGNKVKIVGCFDQDPDITGTDSYIGYMLKECAKGTPYVWLNLNHDTTDLSSLKNKLGKKIIVQGVYAAQETFYPGGSQVLHTISSAIISTDPVN